jgi:beta-mannosidase
VRLDHAWEAASAAPGEEPRDWAPARVPAWAPADGPDLDAFDWHFRTRFLAEPPEPGEEVSLQLDGLATLTEVRLNGELILESTSMFAAHTIDVAHLLDGENELSICARALAPLLEERRRPRARWRTRVAAGNLRFFRTAIFGRAPGFAPGPAPVGPWRPVRLERRRGVVLDHLVLRPRLEGGEGVLAVQAELRAVRGGALPGAAGIELTGPSGIHRAILADGVAELRIPGVARWWPHTHGEPALHEVRVLAGGEPVGPAHAVGFRTLAPGPEPGHDVARDGLQLRVNDTPVFARGAVWTPVGEDELRPTLERARDAGLNMIRVVGTATYESAEFHDLCDELGLLVWQDFMFANFDYPVADAAFRAAVTAEAREVLAGLLGRPSLAVLCGGSEVEQQAAMFGADPALGGGELFTEILPAAIRESGVDAVWVANAPTGGDMPFRTDRGVANYFGVGGYRRPMEDVRRAAVRFASECLAFANVSDEPGLRPGAGVMRDVGADWDFADVREHYLTLLYGAEATPERHATLAADVTGEVMATVFGEWRRAGSRCGGGIILWLRDLEPGAGWGVLDSRGEPKAALGHLRRALAPLAVWMTDEGQNGVAVHVANDGPAPRALTLRLALYRDFEQPVDQATEEVSLAAHATIERRAEAMLGRWADASYAFRFGPPGHDLVVASLEAPDGSLVSRALLFPAGRPPAESAEALGLETIVGDVADGVIAIEVRARRLVHGVRIVAAGWEAEDDAFAIEPGRSHTVALHARGAGAHWWSGGLLHAANLAGALPV